MAQIGCRGGGLGRVRAGLGQAYLPGLFHRQHHRGGDLNLGFLEFEAAELLGQRAELLVKDQVVEKIFLCRLVGKAKIVFDIGKVSELVEDVAFVEVGRGFGGNLIGSQFLVDDLLQDLAVAQVIVAGRSRMSLGHELGQGPQVGLAGSRIEDLELFLADPFDDDKVQALGVFYWQDAGGKPLQLFGIEFEAVEVE